ncbi:MAG: restriction endonuclease subunit S [Dyella sp.]|uniref:restriction endonuclease subunit S n=1 Tax=Dyella sp. TaxID=1869338 RepID=UPI003F7D4CC0
MTWPNVKLADCIESATSGFASGDVDPEGVAQLRMNNVGLDGSLNFEKIRRIPRDASKVSRFCLEEGDVLFNATNSPSLVGKTALIRGLSEPFVFSNHFIRIRVIEYKLDAGFLAKWLTAQQQVGRFELMCNKWVNQASVRREDLLKLEMPLPPLAEQRRIAVILDKADALRVKRREAMAKLDQLLQSVFLDMFGDPSDNPFNWPVRDLGELLKDGPQNGLYKPAQDYGSGTPILRIDGFRAGDIIKVTPAKRVRLTQSEIEKYGLNAGDLVINRVNSPEHLGKPALVQEVLEPTVFESNMMRMAIDTGALRPIYLLKYLVQPFVRDQIAVRRKDAINQSSINQGDVKSLQINVPPLALQKKFEKIHNWIAMQQCRADSSATSLDALFESLQNRAFAGTL